MTEYLLEQTKIYKRLYNELKNCMNNSPQAFERKLEKAIAEGFPINFTDRYGDTLLIKAFCSDKATNAGIPKILLAHGAKRERICGLDYITR